VNDNPFSDPRLREFASREFGEVADEFLAYMVCFCLSLFEGIASNTLYPNSVGTFHHRHLQQQHPVMCGFR